MCALLAGVGPAHSEINFAILNQCDDVAAVYEKLSQHTLNGQCRRPQTKLERRLSIRFPSSTSASLCFLTDAPADFLDGYDCMLQSSETNAAETLVCFRTAAIGDLAEYEDNFPTVYAAPIARYLDEAAKCPVSHGIASNGAPTLFPFLLTPIARYDFGWILSLGSKTPAESSVFHGFARVDPSIASSEAKAIEFVYFIYGATSPSDNLPLRTIGPWHIRVQRGGEFDAEFQKALTANHVPVMVGSAFFDITRESDTALSAAAKNRLISKFEDRIADGLTNEGFEPVPDEELTDTDGNSIEDQLRQLIRQKFTPFGLQAKAREFGGLIVMRKTRQLNCVSNRGIVMAIIASMKPIPNVASDYGNIGLILEGVGTCGPGSSTAKRYLTNLTADAERWVTDEVEKHQ
jgi:hypothetical protein